MNSLEQLYLLPNAEEEIIDSYEEDIIVTNRDGKIIKVSKRSGFYYDLSAAELLGKSVYELEANGIFAPAVTPLVLKQKKKVAVVQIASNNKKILITGIPLFNDQHEVEFIISYSYDVSELKMLQEYLTELEGEMSAVKGELALLREKQLQVNGLIAESKAMQRLLQTVHKIAPLQVSVVLQGENGVGKSTVAKLIHQHSTKKDGPFIKVDCATIPDSIFERELIGDMERGTVGKIGFLQMAQSGTLYLEGVDELSLTGQTVLLKALQRMNSNFRMISASEHDLEKLVSKKEFRDDLFYLLHVVPLHLKPLRERLEDLSKTINKYLNQFNHVYQVNKQLSDPLFHALLDMEWSGNHLEVKNLMERLVVESDTVIITKDDLPPAYRKHDTALEGMGLEGNTLPAIIERIEKEVLLNAQKRYKTTTEMAKALGISQPSVVRKLKKYTD